MTFVVMMIELQRKWDELAAKRGITGCGSKVIVDDVLVFGREKEPLLKYFRAVLDVLKHYQATVNLRKCKWFHGWCEFVGVDVGGRGNSPARSKFAAFEKLERPATWADLRMLIGVFGFYSKHLPLYELCITPWRQVLAAQPGAEAATHRQERKRMAELWTDECEALLTDMKRQVLAGPVLARPDPRRRFYLKTDWSKDGMGAVLLQADDSEEARAAEEREKHGGRCEFDCSASGLCLRPIAFISRKTQTGLLERSSHSYVGEVATIRWAMGKFKKHLVGAEFTVLTDCSGLKTFFENTDHASHVIQCWKAKLLQFHFLIEHRPAQMMWECNMLSRYNCTMDAWREAAEKEPKAHPCKSPPVAGGGDASPTAQASPTATKSIAEVPTCLALPLPPATPSPFCRLSTLPPICCVGQPLWPTADGSLWDPRRSVAVVSAIGAPVEEALAAIRMDPRAAIIRLEHNPDGPLQRAMAEAEPTQDSRAWAAALGQEEDKGPLQIDWLVAVYPYQPADLGTSDPQAAWWATDMVALADLLALRCGLRAAVFLLSHTWPTIA